MSHGSRGEKEKKMTNILLLLKHMANLEPYVGMGERARRITKYPVEAIERLSELALLLVNDAEPKEDFVLLVKV